MATTIALLAAWIHYCYFYRPQRSCEGYVFTPGCHSVHRGGLPQCMLGYHAPPEQTPPPGPGTPPEQTPPQSRHPPGAGTSPSRRLLLRTVRILMECILVLRCVFFQDHCIGSDLEIIDRELNGTYLPYSQGIEMDIFIRDPRNPDEYLEGNL